jgi:hypothetical protein
MAGAADEGDAMELINADEYTDLPAKAKDSRVRSLHLSCPHTHTHTHTHGAMVVRSLGGGV